MRFDYPHLIDPDQWREYLRGYLLADVVVCPSDYSAQILRGYGCQRVTVIPHGFDPPAHIAKIPDRFVVGYLGQPGPDKGLPYLFRAWDGWSSKHPEALLVIAGRGTLDMLPWIREQRFRGSYYVRGEVAEPRDLYDACTLYVQPSCSEAFGCEVIEARAHGRPVVCSDGAGATRLREPGRASLQSRRDRGGDRLLVRAVVCGSAGVDHVRSSIGDRASHLG